MIKWIGTCIITISLIGCAGIQKTVDDVCDVVAEADDRTAALLRTMDAYCEDEEDCDVPEDVRAKARDAAEAVVKAHGYCFQEPAR
jgi:hypothetical protein